MIKFNELMDLVSICLESTFSWPVQMYGNKYLYLNSDCRLGYSYVCITNSKDLYIVIDSAVSLSDRIPYYKLSDIEYDRLIKKFNDKLVSYEAEIKSRELRNGDYSFDEIKKMIK